MKTLQSSLISALFASLFAWSLATGAHAAPGEHHSNGNIADAEKITDVEEIEVIARTGPCGPALTHIPAPNVAYQPGVSTTGNRVAPADLGAQPALTLPDTIAFDILVTPPGTNMANNPASSDARLEGTIGKIKTDLATGTTTVFGRTYAPANVATTCDGGAPSPSPAPSPSHP